MSRKCGITWAKLNSGAGGTKHKGNDKAFMCEAFEERWSADPDLDRTKTKDNVYMTAYRSGLELLNDINHEIAEYNQQLKNSGKRGLRKDAITSFAVIVKPDMEVMGELTREQQIKFFEDAYSLISEKLGTNPDTNVPNVRGGVIQFDEGNPHLHLFGVPYNSAGKLCADDIFRLPLNRWLNEEFPKLMNDKGWNLEPCKDSAGYDADKAKELKKDIETAMQSGNEETVKEAKTALETYKQQCIEYKKSKKKKHGQSATAYKIQSDTEKAVEKAVSEEMTAFEAYERKRLHEISIQRKQVEADAEEVAEAQEAVADEKQELEWEWNTIKREKELIKAEKAKIKADKEAIEVSKQETLKQRNEASNVLRECNKLHENLKFQSKSYAEAPISRIQEKKLVELNQQLSTAFDIEQQKRQQQQHFSFPKI